MSWVTAFVVFVMVWWTVLFAVLPIGTQPQAEADAITGVRGLPARPLIGRKLIATTIVSVLIWGAIMLVIRSDWLSLRPPA